MTEFYYTTEEVEHLCQLYDAISEGPRDSAWPAHYRRVAGHSPTRLELADEIECGLQRGETL